MLAQAAETMPVLMVGQLQAYRLWVKLVWGSSFQGAPHSPGILALEFGIPALEFWCAKENLMQINS